MSEELHNKHQDHGQNEFMNTVAEEIGLQRIIKLWSAHGDLYLHAEASVIEAILGAVWYDSGNDMDEVRKMMDLLCRTTLTKEHALYYPNARQIARRASHP